MLPSHDVWMIPCRLRSTLWLLTFASSAAYFAACNSTPEFEGDSGGDGDGDNGAAGAGNGEADGDSDIEVPVGDGDDSSGASFSVSPKKLQTITVEMGENNPSVEFEALLGDKPVKAGWSVDRGDIASITVGASKTGTITPTGLVGGIVTVTAALNDNVVKREVLVQITGTQNGADTSNPGQTAQIPSQVADLVAGGGPGGVGGEGLGGKVTDEDLLNELNDPSETGEGEELALIYPYEGTVFPRGILAPLISWDWSPGDAEAVKIELTTESGSFSWSGTFGRPAILADAGRAFVQHPIPQNVWEAATNSADGKSDKLLLSLTVAEGGKAYGPLKQEWVIASARLSGTIYYNSYGTNLAKNHGGAVGGDKRFGGATLGIRVGDTGPSLVAGTDGDETYCRVCHSVAADGSRLISSNQVDSFTYDLAADGSLVETQTGAVLEFPGIYPDGSIALSSNGALYELPEATTPLAAVGLSDIASKVGTPMFSADGRRLAFNPMSGGSTTNPKQKVVVMDFDLETLNFSNPIEVVDFTGQPAETRPGWPAFLPDGGSLVFHKQTTAGADGNNHGDLYTRKGARAQIHWASAISSAEATPLNRLNGMDAAGDSYLAPLSAPITLSCSGDGTPVGSIDASHEDDTNLNYEPTVNPVGGGGYAWVVFTSRRRYGHVATIPPFCSDPRGVDLIQNITPKKLWVAAIDLDAKPGEDASHPAFYLPGQELLAGNSRAFWVLDPCRANGDSCESGDQCCKGFCQPDNDDGALVCSDEPPNHTCSELQEKCETTSDCCDGIASCVGGFCTQLMPR